MIYLKEANIEDAKEEYEMISHMPEDENGMTNPDAGISFDDFLRQYHGHIGYGIKREYRGKGYGSKGLSLLLEIGKDIIKEDEFYLSVHKDNTASIKVQKNNGARIVREDELNYYTRISKGL